VFILIPLFGLFDMFLAMKDCQFSTST